MEKQIQKNVITFFTHLSKHVDRWNSMIEESARPLQALLNQSEQLCCVENVQPEDLDLQDLPDLKERLLYSIYRGIDEEISTLNDIIGKLYTANQELRNKLVTLENSTLELDWESSAIVQGSAYQPSLADLVQMGLESWQYYRNVHQNIHNELKTLDVRNEKKMNQLRNCFQIEEDVMTRINFILALTKNCNKEIRFE